MEPDEMKEKALLILLQFCGASVERAAGISSAEGALRQGSAVNWIILPALALGALTSWSYWRGGAGIISPARRCILAGLRLALFSMLLLLPLQPVLSFTVIDEKNPQQPSNTIEAELWSSPLFFFILTLVASTEWALRKRWQLK
jgi:membrane protease YdiL (CAAX protease family)